MTGDARAYDVRPDVTQVFDLDGPRLAALAASVGMPAVVPETPAAPPRPRRAFRLLQKQPASPSAAVLSELPGPELDPAAVRRVLDHPDPVAAGITAGRQSLPDDQPAHLPGPHPAPLRLRSGATHPRPFGRKITFIRTDAGITSRATPSSSPPERAEQCRDPERAARSVGDAP